MAAAAEAEEEPTLCDDGHMDIMEENLFSPSAEGSEAAPSPQSASKSSKATAEEPDVCTICLVNVRGKKQQFCNAPCAGDVKAAERDALRRSGGKQQKAKGEKAPQFEHGSDIVQFRKLKKQGGEGLRAAILAYKARCAGHGRGFARPSFDWVRYSMAVELASRMQTGTKCLWMTHPNFVRYMNKSEDMDPLAAEMEWQRRISDSRQKTDKGGPNGAGRLLISIEDFVITMNEKSQLEKTEWGIKDRRNPTDGDIQALEDVMGTDHHDFQSGFYESVGGPGRGTAVAPNTFGISSAPSATSGPSGVAAGGGGGVVVTSYSSCSSSSSRRSR
jgi:hypothetical protein